LRNQIKRFGVTGFYITVTDYVDAMRPNVVTVEEQNRLRKLCREVGVLFLDDLGVEKGSPASMRALWILINERNKNNLPTIITPTIKCPRFSARPQSNKPFYLRLQKKPRRPILSACALFTTERPFLSSNGRRPWVTGATKTLSAKRPLVP